MMAKEKKIPFTTKDLEGMCGKEFYLVVQREEARADMCGRIEKYRRERESSWESRSWRVVKEFSYGLVGREVPQPVKQDDPEGVLMEIVSRESSSVDGYLIDNVAHVTFEDGTPVNKSITESTLADYLFVLKRVDIPPGQPPVLYGVACNYGNHKEDLYDPGSVQREVVLIPALNMVVHMSKIPDYKSSGTVMWLGAKSLIPSKGWAEKLVPSTNSP